MDGLTDRQKDGQTDGQTDRQTDRQTVPVISDVPAMDDSSSLTSLEGAREVDGRTDRHTDRQTDRQYLLYQMCRP